MISKKKTRLLVIIILSFILVALVANKSKADSSVVYYAGTGHYYQRIDTTKSWESASSYCSALGGYLATVSSYNENQFIYSQLQLTGKSVWLGGTDQSIEGIWKWVNDEPWSYTYWANGEPNNQNNEDCLMYYYNSNAQWNDNPCGYNYVFICEWNQEPKNPCTQESDVIFLALSESKAMIYWEESCLDNSASIYYQRSVEGLKTWSTAKRLISFSDGKNSVIEWEGPLVGGSTIVTAAALQRVAGEAKIYIQTSNDLGATWSGIKLIKKFAGSFFDCPALELQYESKLGLFILTTLIKESNGIYAYVISSSDGINWNLSPKLGRANFPKTCSE